MINILLTGASGFAGCHMLSTLVLLPGVRILCPVTFTHGGNKRRLEDLIKPEHRDRFELLELDLAKTAIDLNSLEINYIVNFASESHVDRSIASPKTFVSNNYLITINLLESIRKSNRRVPLFHVSTDEVYGEILPSVDVVEWKFPFKPSNPYSASKAMQEEIIISYHRTFGISSCIFNITNMIGEAQGTEKFVPKCIKNLKSENVINIDTNSLGDIGSRKYVYVKDVVDAICLVIDLPEWTAGSNESTLDKFHISGKHELSNLEVVDILSTKLGKLPLLTYDKSPREGYDLRYDLNSEKIRSLGWQESLPIQLRLQQIVDWTLANNYWCNEI